MSTCRAPKGYVVSFVSFHERNFSVSAGWFICGVLFEYGLHLQHLNPNSYALVILPLLCILMVILPLFFELCDFALLFADEGSVCP
jgi:hypothetical protein